MAADGSVALVAAAVRAAVLAKALRRTIQAVASAVAGVFERPVAAAAAREPVDSVPAGPQCATPDGFGGASPDALLLALRAARSSRRRAKKERRKANKVGHHATHDVASARGEERRPSVWTSRPPRLLVLRSLCPL